MFMKQNLYVTVLLAAVLSVSIQGYTQTKSSTCVKTVVIDPGHGGADPGAVGKISKEKDLTLDISLLFGEMIKEKYKDINVIYTRTDDSFVELYKRAEIANKNNADLFICVHINASTSHSPYGAETFVMGIDKTGANLQVAKLENSVILKEDNYLDQYEGFDPNDPETHIIFSLYQNANLTQSLSFAQVLQDNFTNKVGRYNRGVKQAGFLVLWKTTMPSVLVELGFISNVEEEKYLNTEAGKLELAEAMFDAFVTYKTKLEEGDSEATNNSSESINQVENDVIYNNNQTETNNSETADNSVLFKIQVLTSTKRMELIPENFKSYQNVDVYLQDGVYKYTIGADSDYNKIVEFHKKVKKDYPDSFIIAMKNGVRIPVNQARSDINNR